MKNIILLAIATLMISGNAKAQNQFDLGSLTDGQAVLNLSATERVEVLQDTLIANLQFTTMGKDKQKLQDELNKAIKKALKHAGDYTTVETSTQYYNVYVYEPGRRTDKVDPADLNWRAQQNLVLESKDSDALLKLAGELQSMEFDMQGLSYTLSRDKYEETTDSLMKDALKKLQNRANEAASVLNKKSASLIEINLDGGQQHYQPRMAMMRSESMAMDKEAVETPSAAPGKTDVSLTVSARALLK